MLELKDICWEVETKTGKQLIVDHINLTLDDDRFYVITGPNGGGKSTLAKIIMGIIKPTSGKIFFNGEDITDLSLTERARRKIGYAFQTPPIFKGITVHDLLQLAAGDKKIDTMQLLYDVGLCAGEYVYRETDSGLSGGELKRIEIASILARDLDFALFDEPEAGIDLWSFQKLAETFEKMRNNNNMTLLIISHQERLMRLADSIIVIEGGHIREITTNEEFLNNFAKKESCGCGETCVNGVVK